MSIRKLVFKIKIKSGGCLVHRKPWHIDVDLVTRSGIANRGQKTESRRQIAGGGGGQAPPSPKKLRRARQRTAR